MNNYENFALTTVLFFKLYILKSVSCRDIFLEYVNISFVIDSRLLLTFPTLPLVRLYSIAPVP